MEDAALFRLSILQVDGMRRTIELPPLDVTFPHVDVFPDGKILLLASRSGWRANGGYDLNGIVFDPKTANIHASISATASTAPISTRSAAFGSPISTRESLAARSGPPDWFASPSAGMRFGNIRQTTGWLIATR